MRAPLDQSTGHFTLQALDRPLSRGNVNAEPEGKASFEAVGIALNGETIPFEGKMIRSSRQAGHLKQKVFVLILRDRRAELEADRIQENYKAKCNFFACMTHELRTPPNGLLGAVDLLKCTQFTDIQADYLNMMQVSGSQLAEVINDVLDASKIEAGAIQVEAIPFSSLDILNKVEQITEPLVQGNSIQLRFHNDSNLPTYLVGDSGKVTRILINFVSNAIKFTSEGEVSVTASSVVDSSGRPQRVQFLVKDTGIGISQEALSKLFMPFQQAEASTSRKFGGTGLGLSISKQLIELMGGQLILESKLGDGSVFGFEIPLIEWVGSYDGVSPRGEAIKALSLESGPNLSRLKVLIVDDQQVNARLVVQMLEHLGLKGEKNPIVAFSGQEALDLIQSNQFDYVFLDYEMPGLDGIQTALRMIEVDESYLNRIIFTTADPDNLNKKIREIGRSELFSVENLSKPIRLQQLKDFFGKSDGCL